MGLENTLVSDSCFMGTLPSWFTEGYEPFFYFNDELIASKTRKKFYGGREFFEDCQQALNEIGYFEKSDEFLFVILNALKSVSKAVIKKDSIKFYYMVEDVESDNPFEY